MTRSAAHRIGLLHLAMNSNDLNANDLYALDPDDLKHVVVGTFDPRDMFDRWGRLPLAFVPVRDSDRVRDCESAERWLRKEDIVYGRGNRIRSKIPIDLSPPRSRGDSGRRISGGRLGANHPKYGDEDLGKAVKPAFGFWLFPLEPLGAVTTAADGGSLIQPAGYRSEAKRLLDLSGYWPELGLFRL